MRRTKALAAFCLIVTLAGVAAVGETTPVMTQRPVPPVIAMTPLPAANVIPPVRLPWRTAATGSLATPVPNSDVVEATRHSSGLAYEIRQDNASSFEGWLDPNRPMYGIYPGGHTLRVAILPPFMRIDYPQRGTTAIVDCVRRRITTFATGLGTMRVDFEIVRPPRPPDPPPSTVRVSSVLDVHSLGSTTFKGMHVDLFEAVFGELSLGEDPRLAPITKPVRGPSRFAIARIPEPELACSDMLVEITTLAALTQRDIVPDALANGSEATAHMAYRGVPLPDGLIVAAGNSSTSPAFGNLPPTTTYEVVRLFGIRRLAPSDAPLFFSPVGYVNRVDAPSLSN